MKFVVVLLALAAVVFGQDAALCNSGVQATNGAQYNLAGLTKQNGDYYSYTDSQTGITYYWNTCSEINDLCGDDAAACFSVGGGGDMNVQSFFKAGSYDNFFYDVYSDQDDEKIVVTFYGGEYCADLNTDRQISFVYHCSPYVTEANVTSVDNNQDCGVTINIDTAYACGQIWADGTWGEPSHHFHILHNIMIFVWIFVALSACVCCCACCAIIRRRRCQNRTGGWCKRYCSSKKGAYAELSTIETPVVQQPVPQPQPTAPVAQQPALAPPQFYPVQYIPAQQYYMMQQQYMQQQQQFMQTQAQQPAPVVELENVGQDIQIDADEKLARELQAQFNAEN
jgi:hypothetical protein